MTTADGVRALELPVTAGDGHAFTLLARVPATPRRMLLWLPALGIAAKHYLPVADALAARGVAVFLHEWRGNGSSALRASRTDDWGYRELLGLDIPASAEAMAATVAGVPGTLGGHSLGGQLAACRLALAPDSADALWLAGSGAPYWRAFPLRQRAWLPLVYRFLPWLAARNGVLPGRRVGFGGNEARSLVADWARSGTTGRYAARGVDVDLEAALRRVHVPVRACVFADDWLGPPSSLRFLLSKVPEAPADIVVLDAATLGTRADHYAWMRAPDAVARHFVPG